MQKRILLKRSIDVRWKQQAPIQLPPKAWVGIALFVVGIGMLMSSRRLPPTPLKGWLTILGFGLGSLPLVFALITPTHRRRSLAFGVVFMLFGIYFGVPNIWAARPSWFEPLLVASQFLAVAWLLREGMLANRPGPGSD